MPNQALRATVFMPRVRPHAGLDQANQDNAMLREKMRSESRRINAGSRALGHHTNLRSKTRNRRRSALGHTG